jgi:hypothetical protein
MSNASRHINRRTELPEHAKVRGKIFHRVTVQASDFDESGCPRTVRVLRPDDVPTVDSDETKFYVIYVPHNMIPPEVN